MKRPTWPSLDRAAVMLSVNTMEMGMPMNAELAATLAEEVYILANALDARASKCELPPPTKIPGGIDGEGSDT